MAILGIDYGRKKMGVAISEGEWARGFMIVHRNEAEERLTHLCREKEVTKIILGLPEGYLEEEVRQFASSLQHTLHIPVLLWDESLSTKRALESQKLLNKKGQEDMQAAALILQSYIDETRKTA